MPNENLSLDEKRRRTNPHQDHLLRCESLCASDKYRSWWSHNTTRRAPSIIRERRRSSRQPPHSFLPPPAALLLPAAAASSSGIVASTAASPPFTLRSTSFCLMKPGQKGGWYCRSEGLPSGARPAAAWRGEGFRRELTGAGARAEAARHAGRASAPFPPAAAPGSWPTSARSGSRRWARAGRARRCQRESRHVSAIIIQQTAPRLKVMAAQTCSGTSFSVTRASFGTGSVSSVYLLGMKKETGLGGRGAVGGGR